MNEHRQAIEAERDKLLAQVDALERAGGTFAELRVLQRQIEHLEHQLIWLDRAPRGWFV